MAAVAPSPPSTEEREESPTLPARSSLPSCDSPAPFLGKVSRHPDGSHSRVSFSFSRRSVVRDNKQPAAAPSSCVSERLSASRSSFNSLRRCSQCESERRASGSRKSYENPSLRDKVAMSSNTAMPWSATAELMRQYSTVPDGEPPRSDDIANNGFQIMMEIRTQEDVTSADRYKLYRKLLVHPSAPWLSHWMGLVYCCLIVNLIVIPFRGVFDPFGEVVCYSPGDLSSCHGSYHPPLSYQAMEFVIDSVFVLDMILNFRLGFYLHMRSNCNQVQMDWRQIGINYLRLWFWIDVISVLPWQYMDFSNGSGGPGRSLMLLRNLRMIRLLRVFKLLRIRSFFQNWHKNGGAFSHPLFARLMRYLLFTIVVAHLLACILFVLPQLEGVPEDSWVVNEGIAIEPGRDVFKQYTTCLYWTIMTLTTVGYGDVSMRRPLERCYASFTMLTGAVMFAYTVSNVAQVVREFDAGPTIIREKMDAINQYMGYRQLPQELQSRIRKYYSFYWSRQSIFDESVILSQLPSHLRREVTLFLHKDMISKVPVFQDADSSFIASLVTVLAPLQTAPGDYITVAGEVGLEMYFIDFGHVDIWSADLQQLYRTCSPGDFFGEVSLLTRERRTATCQAVTYSELWSLNRDDLDKLLLDYPEMRETLKAQALQRLRTSMQYSNCPASNSGTGFEAVAKHNAGGHESPNLICPTNRKMLSKSSRCRLRLTEDTLEEEPCQPSQQQCERQASEKVLILRNVLRRHLAWEEGSISRRRLQLEGEAKGRGRRRSCGVEGSGCASLAEASFAKMAKGNQMDVIRRAINKMKSGGLDPTCEQPAESGRKLAPDSSDLRALVSDSHNKSRHQMETLASKVSKIDSRVASIEGIAKRLLEDQVRCTAAVEALSMKMEVSMHADGRGSDLKP